MIEAAIVGSGYLAALEAEHTVEAQGRIENLAELVGVAKDFDDVDSFLEMVGLVADVDSLDADESAVVLMTLHAAKGLEFPVVFLTGLEDGVFPHLRSLTEPHEMEEERRLAYVGITRARERLYLTSAWSRTIFGSTQYNPPSRFLDEIPAGLLSEVGGRRRGQAGSGLAPRSGSDGDDSGGRIFGGRSRIVESAIRPGPRRRRARGRDPRAAGGRGRPPRQVRRGRHPRGHRVRARRPRRSCGSGTSARSACSCRGPRSRS